MKIKNTRELILRADGHARHDRIEQGTYGDARCNGAVEFRGCAIGCLATPHRKFELRDFIQKFGAWTSPGAGAWYGSEPGWYLSEHGVDQIKRLRREFGICAELARVAEAYFESQLTHGGAIEFIPKFARALPEGVNISPRKVNAFWTSIGGGLVSAEHASPWDIINYSDPRSGKLFAWLKSM